MAGRKFVRLLVIDEHQAYCDLLKQSADIWNSHYEIECAFAETGGKGLELIGSFEPTVIMVDAYIPDMSCVEFIRRCKEKHTPLVVTSEISSTQLQDTAVSWGADAYFMKTQDPEELEGILARVAGMAVERKPAH